MTRHLPTFRVAAVCLAALLGATGAAESRQAASVPAGGRQATSTSVAGQAVPQSPERGPFASETRESLKSLLEACPPSLGRVLKLDPSLMSNQAYLAPYPGLAAFLSRHPEITRDPRYFLESVYVGNEYRMTAEEQAITMWRNMMEGTAMFLVFFVLTGAVIWLIKSIIDYRRWNRVSKVHVEVHNKLLDRFSNNEELLAYVQSPAGLRFLETAPRNLNLDTTDLNMPVRRILWAIQAGIVLAATGSGLLIVSDQVIAEMQPPLFAIGTVVLALGLGFVIAAIVSYVLTRRMGLMNGARPSAPVV